MIKGLSLSDVAQDVEDGSHAVWVKVFFDLAHALEQFVQNAPFAGVGGNEVETPMCSIESVL